MSNRSILIVEDEREIREVLQQALEFEGYTTLAASNGAEAMDALDKETPALILLDLMMPVMDGWEFLERRKPRDAAIPVIVVSAVAGMGSRSAKADAFLKKPVELDTLLQTVEKCMVAS